MGVLVTTVVRGRTVSYEVDTRALPPLDASDPATFDRWCATPEHDTRTFDEFVAEGGRRCPPPCNNITLYR
jgi:hypothetical protein